MAEIVNKEKFNELVNSGELVIVDFFATWCGPCQMFLPVFDEVSSETGLNMVKVDIDQETDIAGDHGVMGVPTIVAFKGGQEVSRFSGFRPKEELLSFIEAVKQ